MFSSGALKTARTWFPSKHPVVSCSLSRVNVKHTTCKRFPIRVTSPDNFTLIFLDLTSSQSVGEESIRCWIRNRSLSSNSYCTHSMSLGNGFMSQRLFGSLIRSFTLTGRLSRIRDMRMRILWMIVTNYSTPLWIISSIARALFQRAPLNHSNKVNTWLE